MKKPYAESTLKRKLRETGIPKQVLDKLHLYLTACASFYRVLSIDEVWRVIRRTERRLGKIAPEEFFNADLLECMRFFLVDEFQRQLQDDLMSEEDDSPGAFKETLLDEVAKREAEYERREKQKIMRLADVLVTPLTSEGPRFTEGDYELTREDFDKVIAIKERACDRYFVFPENELYEDGDPKTKYLVNIEDVMVFEGGEPIDMTLAAVYEILDGSAGKPLFIPEDLLYYISPGYYEETPQTNAMKSFLKKAFFAGEDPEDTDLDLDIMMKRLHSIVTDAAMSPMENVNQATSLLEQHDCILSGFEQAQEFIRLFMDMSNHTRLPVNKGNTPKGLAPEDGMRMPNSISFGPGIQELLRSGELDPAEMKRDIMTESRLPIELRGNMMKEIDRALEPGEERIVNATGTIVKGRKIKPNEPCPCGSGRKYKHCCGKR